MPSKSRHPSLRRRSYIPQNSSGPRLPVPDRHRADPLEGPLDFEPTLSPTFSPDPPVLPQHPAWGENGNGTGAEATAHPSRSAPTRLEAPPRPHGFQDGEDPANHVRQTSDSGPPPSPLRPSSPHSLRQITVHRSRSGMWTTLALVTLAAALTVVLLTLVGNSEQSGAETRSAVLAAATVAAGAVNDSTSVLESLRAESSFTPELVASISSLGDASRHLVESVTALSTDDPTLAELRMLATGLAGRVSRLGETFGAALSYRGQVEPHLSFPSLNDPLNISNLSDNTTLLTEWQFRLEQVASTRPNQPRLSQNQEALGAMLPYIEVHSQAYADGIGNGQSEQAAAALSQIASLLSALRQDFDRAYDEIVEIAQAEIQSLTADLQVLSKGIRST